MKYLLPSNSLYGNTPVSIELPDNWVVNTYSYTGDNTKALTESEIQKKINSPIGKKPIVEGAKGKQNAVIIIDDISRPLNASSIVRRVISELGKAGIQRENIRIIFATGMHRAMYREDYVRKLDEELVSEFVIYSHNPFYSNILVGYGIHNTPIELNTDCVRAGYKIAIGTIQQHAHTGLGGGGKILVPGIASAETIRRFHLYPKKSWDISSDMRTIGNQAMKLLPLDYKIDALLNGNGEIADLYAGDSELIIYENYSKIKDFFSTEKPEPADVVILNNYFKPTEPAVAYSDSAVFDFVKKDGSVVVSSNTPQGVAPHYLLGRWGATYTGGPMFYDRRDTIPPHIKHYFAFSEYLDKGAGYMFHLNGEQFMWVNRFDQIVEQIGIDERTVTILPYADASYYI